MSKLFVDQTQVSQERYDKVKSCMNAINILFIIKKVNFEDGLAVLLNAAYDAFIIQKTVIEDVKLSDALDQFEDHMSEFIAMKRQFIEEKKNV